MPRIRIGIIGAQTLSEWGLVPCLYSPDLATPLDDGLWWSRRPSSNPAIQWQSEFEVDVVALCEADGEKRERLAGTYRIDSAYSDRGAMLREQSLDAIFCEDAARENLPELVAQMARSGARHLWLGGVPAASAGDAAEFAHWADAHGVRIWSGRPVRSAAAHRAALALIKRGEIGDVTALCLRWNTPFSASGDAPLRSATYAAIDLLLAGAGSAPLQVLMSQGHSSGSLLLEFAGEASATATFATADSWNAPWPRLEVIGTRGRSLVCEAGRRMAFYQPREAARCIEPPSLAAHVSSHGVNGLAEDIKAFLTACCLPVRDAAANAGSRAWTETVHALATLEAATQSVETKQFVSVRRDYATGESTLATADSGELRDNSRVQQPVLTLPLSL